MRKRNQRIVIHLTDRELAKFNQSVEATGLPRETVLRELINGCEVRPKPPDCYRDLVREMSAIGNALYQLWHFARRCGTISEEQYQESHRLLGEAWRCLHEHFM